MKLTTPVPIMPQEPGIDHHSKIFLAGSCFVENIGEKFDYFKLPNKRNPFGILYHPFGIRDLISNAVTGHKFTAEDVFFHNERWHCFQAHSSLSNRDREELISGLNGEVAQTREFLKKATHIILTPGTSWIYRQARNDQPVVNCHKLPQNNFKKEISDIAELKDAMNTTVAMIREINAQAPVIFTISPVRHIKDGLLENQLSKSLLFVAVNHALNEHPSTFYFPSYEILMDELRDYRFYAEDMLHPGKVGVDYIWDKFVQAWFSSETKNVMKDLDSIQKGLSHRPFHDNSAAHQKFVSDLKRKIESVKARYPHLSF